MPVDPAALTIAESVTAGMADEEKELIHATSVTHSVCPSNTRN
jgi:hypothetical protein